MASDLGLHCLPLTQQNLRYIKRLWNGFFQILGQLCEVVKVSQYLGYIQYVIHKTKFTIFTQDVLTP